MPRTLDVVTAEVNSSWPSGIEFRTIRLDNDQRFMSAPALMPPDGIPITDFYTLGSLSGLLWAKSGRIIAGLGPVQRMPPTSTDLAVVPGRDDLQIPGTGPVAFAALPFKLPQRINEPASELLLPEVVLAVDPDGRRWATVLLTGAAAMSDESVIDHVLHRVAELGPTQGAGTDTATDVAEAAHREPTEVTLRSGLAPEYWRDEIVASACALIRSGELNKVVLARELSVTADASFDQPTIMARLAATFPTANLFLVDGFFGASPETLISRMGDVVTAHPLAGTLPRSNDPNRDRELAAQLLASDKNRWEHRITIDWLLDTLLPFCSYVDAEPEPSLVSLANVHHLGTKVEGRLSSPPTSVLDLVAALHPTPAVGGEPQKKALDVIDELEQADRGRYAGPTGWIDAAGNGQFAVSVRSAQFVAPNRVDLFAGVGVVADSDPQEELDETRAKFRAILGALVQP